MGSSVEVRAMTDFGAWVVVFERISKLSSIILIAEMRFADIP